MGQEWQSSCSSLHCELVTSSLGALLTGTDIFCLQDIPTGMETVMHSCSTNSVKLPKRNCTLVMRQIVLKDILDAVRLALDAGKHQICMVIGHMAMIV